MSSTHGENLGGLIGDWELIFPDGAPTTNQVLRVTNVDTPNQIAKFGYFSIPAFDPLKSLTLTGKKLSLTTTGGTALSADISGINNQLKSVTEDGKKLVFTLKDDTKVEYTPTLFHPDLKANKTTKIISSDTAAIKIVDETLKDDVTLKVLTNVKNGLLKLSVKGEIPSTISGKLISSDNFLALPTTMHNPVAGTAAPTGTLGELLYIGTPGPMDVVDLTGSFVSAMSMLPGDILRWGMDAAWHLISRSSLPTKKAATDVTVTAFGTPPVGTNVQSVLNKLYDISVHTTRKIISDDINELTVNGLVEHKLDQDITLELMTNRPNAVLKLDSGGLIPNSRLPTSAFEFHGVIDATAAFPLKRPDHRTDWTAGDTLEISVGCTALNAGFPVVATGSTVPARIALAPGDVIVRDSAGNWILSANGGAIRSSDVVTGAGVVGLKNLLAGSANLPNLNSVLQSLNNNAVWLLGDQTIDGSKTFNNKTVIHNTLEVGAVSDSYIFPAVKPSQKGQTLVGDVNGTVTWDNIPAHNVDFHVDTVIGTTLDRVLKDIYDNQVVRRTPKKIQILGGEAAGHHTALGRNTGVIMGDGSTENQIAKTVMSAGTF